MRKIYYFIFLCIALPSFLAGCNKDEAEAELVTPALTPMHKMYNESVTLTEATLDSITSFCDKFCGYVNLHFECDNKRPKIDKQLEEIENLLGIK